MLPIYLTKNLAAASSNGIGSISTAAPSVVTLNSSFVFDTGRRIVFTSTGDASTLLLTFTGRGETRGGVFSETVRGSTAAGINATTTSDFISVTSVAFSSNLNIPALLGTSSFGGTPWKPLNVHISQFQVGVQLVYSSTANSMQAQVDMTADDPFASSLSIAPGGIVQPLNQPVAVFTSTSVSTAGGNSIGVINIPISAVRLTLTSSSSGAGSANLTIVQAGIG